jgi:hypothetical protein
MSTFLRKNSKKYVSKSLKRRQKRLIKSFKSETLIREGIHTVKSVHCKTCSKLRKISRILTDRIQNLDKVNHSSRRRILYWTSKLFEVSIKFRFTICGCTLKILRELATKFSPGDFNFVKTTLLSYQKVKNSSSALVDSNRLGPIKSERARITNVVMNSIVNTIDFTSITKDVKTKKCKFHFMTSLQSG